MGLLKETYKKLNMGLLDRDPYLRYNTGYNCGRVPNWIRERIANPLVVGSIPTLPFKEL